MRLSLSCKIGTVVAALALVAAVNAAAAAPPAHREAAGPVWRARYLMGTVCDAVAFATESLSDRDTASAIERAFDEMARLEEVLSDYRETSELSRLNRDAAQRHVPCSQDLYEFMTAAVSYSRMTNGAFDVTVAPLVRLWDLRGAGRAAGPLEVEETLRHVGASLIELHAEGRTIRFAREGVSIDPGALGKGFALDAAAAVLRRRGVRAALLDFGGQVLAIGSPPGQPAWTVDIAHPVRRDEAALTIKVRDASVSTSGNSERVVMLDGTPVGHIVDPKTGMPLRTRGSVTVIAASGAEADALSTALLVMGPHEGLRWSEAHPAMSAVFLDADSSGGLMVRPTQNFEMNDSDGGPPADHHTDRGSR